MAKGMNKKATKYNTMIAKIGVIKLMTKINIPSKTYPKSTFTNPLNISFPVPEKWKCSLFRTVFP